MIEPLELKRKIWTLSKRFRINWKEIWELPFPEPKSSVCSSAKKGAKRNPSQERRCSQYE